MRPARTLAVTAALCAATWAWLGSRDALGQHAPIEDRDYAIDLPQSVVLGSIRVVGMAGAATSLAEGSVGMLANPAAPAVRPATSSDTWDWDWHIDWLSPGLGSDFDNSGTVTDEELVVAPLLTGGLVVQYKNWALGLGANISKRHLALDADNALEPSFAVGRLILARSWRDVTVGVGVRGGTFTMTAQSSSGMGDERTTVASKLFELSGTGLEAGAIWRPRDRDVRVGMSASLPVTGVEVRVVDCDPTDCLGYILPTSLRVPWRVALGGSWRFAKTRWNRQIEGDWRDERYVLVAADVVLQGAVADSYSVEGFVRQVQQPSGRSVSASPRLGVEYEWLPGRLRVRGGSYYEPGRVADVGGRLHGTLGIDVRFWSFCFAGDRYRARLSFTADVARRYGNTGVSVGLWH